MKSSGHLSQAELFNLVDGLEGPAGAFTSLLHLKRCPPCRARLITEYPTDGPVLVHEFNLNSSGQPLPPVAANAPLWVVEQKPDAVIGASLEAWATGSEAIERELLEAPALARELEGVAPARQHLALEAPRFHTLGFGIHLLTKSSGLWHKGPADACRLARLAVIVASKLDSGAYPVGLAADLHCGALAYLGNSLRLKGRLQEAEGKLTEAQSYLANGTGDLILRARVLELLAELHRDQRLFPLALCKAREAFEICQRLGDAPNEARLMLIHASILGAKGDAAGAIAELQGLVNTIPRSVMGEEVYWSVRQNLCQSLVEADQLWEARRELHAVRGWARREGKALVSARVRWTEALLVAREGDFAGATSRLVHVRDVLLRNGLPYDAALACLDLAAVYLERGRPSEAQKLARFLAPIFRAGGIQREALASLRVLASTLTEKSATASHVKLLQQYLTRQRRRVKHD